MSSQTLPVNVLLRSDIQRPIKIKDPKADTGKKTVRLTLALVKVRLMHTLKLVLVRLGKCIIELWLHEIIK